MACFQSLCGGRAPKTARNRPFLPPNHRHLDYIVLPALSIVAHLLRILQSPWSQLACLFSYERPQWHLFIGLILSRSVLQFITSSDSTVVYSLPLPELDQDRFWRTSHLEPPSCWEYALQLYHYLKCPSRRHHLTYRSIPSPPPTNWRLSSIASIQRRLDST